MRRLCGFVGDRLHADLLPALSKAKWRAPPASPSPTQARHIYTHVPTGDTLFEAVNNAMNWFADPYWIGPRPAPNTVFEVTLVGEERAWRVPAQRVMKWRHDQPLSSGQVF